MKIDIIIATYNRHKSLQRVIEKLLDSTSKIANVIVVDSSKDENRKIQQLKKVKYIRSSYANQPYQRYLGFLSSDADILIFLDDDMELIDSLWIEKIENVFLDDMVVGAAIAFNNENEFLNMKLPKTKFGNPKKANIIHRAIKAFTGHPYLGPGKFWLCGIRGKQPINGGSTEWFQGGAFATRRNAIYKDFNFYLFDLFEHKLGMGEDVILGYTLSKQGKIVYIPQELFCHNDQKDSTYTVDLQSFGKRVAYSRLYLSYEYGRLSGLHRSLILMHYIWYMLWRLMGMGINLMIDPKKSRKEMIKGYYSGVIAALKNRKNLSTYDDGQSWKKEAENDINS